MKTKHNKQFIAKLNGQQQHFGLRKFSVGLASVLLGTSFFLMGNGNQAKADTYSLGNRSEQVVNNEDSSNDDQNDTASEAANQANQSNEQSINYQSKSDYKSTYPNPAHEDTKAGAVSVSDNKGSNNNDSTAVTKNVPTVKANIPSNFVNPIHVRTWDEFDRAFKDTNVDQIVLENNIDVNRRGGDKIIYDQRGIARTLEITSAGNKRYSLNFNRYFMGLYDQPQRTGHDWNLIFKNVDITSENKNYAPIFTRNVNVNYSKRNTFTFDNVNFRGHNFIEADACNIVFAGKVNIDSLLEGGDNNVITAYSVKMADGSNVTMNVRQDSWVRENTTWNVGGTNAIKTMYNDSNDAVVIGSGAHFALNPNQAQTNVRGFVFADRARMIIAEGAKVEMNMGKGNTSAILAARDLIVKPTAVLDIKTMQDNGGRQPWGDDPNLSTHISPISIGFWKAGNGNSSFTIEKDATVRIVRSDSGRPTITTLVSFGSDGSNPHCTYDFNVKDDATLDLQDASQSTWHGYGAKNFARYLGDDDQVQVTGLIAMYGIVSDDHLNFGNVKYVNLQRTGYQHGNLIRLEGGSNSTGSNAARINGKEVPLAQWQANNRGKKADFTWNVDQLHTENKMGNFASNYNLKFQRTGTNPTRNQQSTDYSFDQTTSSVRFSDGKSVEQHQDFNRNFSWWKAQRIAFGSALEPQSKRYGVAVNEAFLTHVNAQVNKSNELDLASAANKAKLVWHDNKTGKDVEAPAGVKAYWSVVPNTSRATAANQPDKTGRITFIFADDSTKTIVAPTVVYGAKAINGLKAHKGEPATMPTAEDATNVSDLTEHNFGIDSIVWADKPSIEFADPAVPGVTRVNYSDGTSEDVDVTIDVLDVTHGKDHKDQKDIYKNITRTINITDPAGNKSSHVQTVNFTRDRYTDLALKPGQEGYITYSKWTVDGKDSYDRYNLARYTHEKAVATNNGAAFALGQAGQVQYVPAQMNVSVNDKNQVIEVTYEDTRTDAQKYIAHVNKGLETHVNATVQTPSLNKDQITFDWTKDGKTIAQPAGITTAWTQNPDTSKAGDVNGQVTITFKDGSKETVNVPVSVATAKAINGLQAKQNEPETIPAATAVTNTTDVNKFGVKSVTWKQVPNIAEMNPASVGVTTVNYNDGTSQDITVTVDVLGVTHGKDHKDQNDINRTITREIIEKQPAGDKKFDQSFTFYRDRYTDAAIEEGKPGHITYGAWNEASHELPAHTVTVVPGYTASQKTVEAVTITPDSKNSSVVVTYNADSQKQVVNYVDNSDKKTVVGTYSRAGKTDETINLGIENNVPKNWKLVSGQDIAGMDKVTLSSTEKPAVVVYVEHATANDDTDTKRTVTRTITAYVPGWKKPQVTTQVAHFTRTGTKDLVTNKTTYTDWTSNDATWKEFDPLRVSGYTANPSVVEAKTVTADSKDENVVVNYDADTLNQLVLYKNINGGDTVKTDNIEGKSNSDSDFKLNVPAGWVLTKGQTFPKTIHFGTYAPEPITVWVQHGTEDVNKDTEKTVTRTVNYIDPLTGETKNVTVQTAKLTRTGKKDLVTGKITYTPWDEKHLDRVDAPSIAGFRVQNPDAADAMVVTSNTADSTVVFTYNANEQVQVINYVAKDKPSEVLATDSVIGNTGVKGSYAVKDAKIPAGWVLAEGQAKTLNFTFAPNAKALNVYLAHGMKVDPKGESKTFTRNVYTQIGNQDKEFYQKQTAVIYRSTTTDEVTGGVVARGNWNTSAIDSLAAPAKVGYTVTNPNAAGRVTVDSSMPEQLADVTFNYTADAQNQVFNYVDKNSNQTVGSASMTGKTDEKASFDANSKMPAGYKLADGQTATVNFTFSANSSAINIYVVKTSEAENNHASTNDTVVTHIGANEQSPSLNPSKINLVWKDNDGNILNEQQAPKGYQIDWKTVPATTEVTSEENKETGVLTITFQDKSSEDVNVPVTVKGATAINGVKVNQGDAVPAADGSVDTKDVKQFDFKDVTWKNAPSTEVPGANIPGTARVNYDDGTYQDVDVTIDVLKVEDGRDHKDQKDLYMFSYGWIMQRNPDGTFKRVSTTKYYYKVRTTDLADGSVNETNWLLDKDATDAATKKNATPVVSAVAVKTDSDKKAADTTLTTDKEEAKAENKESVNSDSTKSEANSDSTKSSSATTNSSMTSNTQEA